MNQASAPRNHLGDETSPYLLQHAHNPVDWYPWCDQALALARREDKPILLSIGYSACHWCHVMAHESFEDEQTAARMNELFVNIKVDREERPDLDKIYQLAHQLLARRSGGWPLTVFLNPHDHVPFFTGTYFPKEARYNLPGFVWLMGQVSGFYHQKKDALKDSSLAFVEVLRSLTPAAASDELLDPALLDVTRQKMGQEFDAHHGGFGGAPKFPHPSSLEFLMRHWHRSGGSDGEARRMAVLTLAKMAQGGIYDQLGGGFCRYSVDAAWQIPHFEKMLYDNGPLLALYSEAWQITGAPVFKQVAEGIAEWVTREMQAPEGGYYASLDADSEGEEGKFYVWDLAEVESLLSAEEFPVVALHFGLSRPANFEGHWHFCVDMPLADVALHLNLEPSEAETRLASARAKLLAARAIRIRPNRDEKILTAWNALMVKGMAVAGRLFDRPDFVTSAQSAVDFLKGQVWRDEHLLATYKDGRSRFPAYLDDYAFLLDALVELLQTSWRDEDLGWASSLAEDLLARFEDAEHGGFYFTAHDHESLIHRAKPTMDEAVPAGNGLAARALLSLGHLTGETRWLTAAERALQAAAVKMNEHPTAHATTLIALEDHCFPSQIIVCRGNEEHLRDIQALSRRDYQPKRVFYAIPDTVNALPGLLAERTRQGNFTAYVCVAGHCLPPFDSLLALEEWLNSA